MGAHQFRLGGTREVQIGRKRKKANRRVASHAAQLDQTTLELALADVEDDRKRIAVYEKVRPSLTFAPDPDTLLHAQVRRAIRDEVHLVSTILRLPPEKRREARDMLLPLCPWTPSADALATIEAAIPSGLVTPEGTPVDAATPAPAIVLTDV